MQNLKQTKFPGHNKSDANVQAAKSHNKSEATVQTGKVTSLEFLLYE